MTRPAISAMIIALQVFAGSVVLAGQDEDAVQALLIDSAKATSEFSRTRDPQSVLKAYAKDYVGIQDGESETRETIEKWLSEYGAELDKGNPTRFLGEVFGIKVRVSGALAWATYDYVFKLIANGEIQTEDRGLCTSILRKEGSTWLIQHEHCSKPRPAK
ncbi:MAG TPA: nuclear transport factor 2 family protein [Nitrospira sp.]|nr:nuclear transport factor 2 family protein [Nitrospira sp.]